MGCVDLTIKACGTINKVKLTKTKIKEIPVKKRDDKSILYIRDQKGNAYAWGTYNPKKWSGYSYGHNTLDVEFRADKARFLDDEDELGNVGVRMERFQEVRLVTLIHGQLEDVFDKGTTIKTEDGTIDCAARSMSSDEHRNYYFEGISHLVNKENEQNADRGNIDITFYDHKLGRSWPLEIGDPPLVHGQLRVVTDNYGPGNSVSFAKLLLVESIVLSDENPMSRGHPEKGRYFMSYYVENKKGKRFKKQREYYDERRDHFWMKNRWYQRYTTMNYGE